MTQQELIPQEIRNSAIINNFKFIELPVQLKVRLGKGNTFPVFWTGGITLSQLINSNALQFDPYTATYYKNNSLFNKTQIGLNTGLLSSTFPKSKGRNFIWSIFLLFSFSTGQQRIV